ncbi:MAG TPA: cupredoxin domain-containing protein [Solirubrobacteraceae bacterium]|nr:cupredoxin domain-containing protein [Solirubrobacteraceae bacterium]
MSRSILLPAVLAVVALVLGACGNDDVFRTDRPILRLSLDEYRVVPQTIVVVKPGRMKFDVRNSGRLTHNLAIQIPEGPDGKPVEITRTETVQPGERAEPIKVTLQPGEYRLVCTIANHDDLGQFGSLEVQR